MNSINLLEGLVGWSIGYDFLKARNKEVEIKQGKNFYLACFAQYAEISGLATVIKKINESVPKHPLKKPINLACQVSPILLLPFTLLCAAVKEGAYETVASNYNNSILAYIKLPKKLGDRTIACMKFISNHVGNISQVCMIAGSVALIAMGNAAFGGAVLVALTYASIDSFGLVPQKISLFMETYMPTVSLVGTLIGGMAINKVFSACLLTTYLFPSSFNHCVHHKVDLFIRNIYNSGGVTLQEVEAPLIRKELDFEGIKEILDRHENDFEINPAHCSKWVMGSDELLQEHNFESYLDLFDRIDWKSKMHVFKKKFKEDDNFIDFLADKFPEVQKKEDYKKELQKNCDRYIAKLAGDENIGEDEYLANWMREQMKILVSVLVGPRRVKGLQKDLEDAKNDLAKLLPYLRSLENQVELEDMLAKLAIEGGDYCARGIKRVANELIRGVLQGGIANRSIEEIDDQVKNYEMQIEQALQNARYKILLDAYQTLMKEVHIPDDVSHDTHLFDVYRTLLSIGFYPLTDYEGNETGIGEIVAWQTYAQNRVEMFSKYRKRLDEIIKEQNGEAYFIGYIHKILSECGLNQEQKNEILARWDGRWGFEETMKRFHRLLYVKLGVLRF